VLPAKWAEDVSARARDEGSLRTEQLFFKGGFLSYDQYYRGGFRTRTPDDLIELAKRLFDHATFGEPQLTTVPLGQIRYLTLQVPDKETCFVLLANQGPFTQLQGGRGTTGQLKGVFCQDISITPTQTRDRALALLEELSIKR